MKNRAAIFALIAAGTLWGLTSALSKLSLEWLDPTWLAALRFLVAAPLLAVAGWSGLRAACTLRIALWGAFGIGLATLLQNAGIQDTSVSHAAIIVGALPVFVAIIAVVLGHGRAGLAPWFGYGLAVVGVVMVASGAGGGTGDRGDALVFASVIASAILIAHQPRLLQGRDPAAVIAVQFAASAVIAAPMALISHGVPDAPAHAGPVIAFIALTLPGTVFAFWLFAYGQSRTAADLAGAFVNLEPLVGAIVGWVAFANPCGVLQLAGAAAVIGGILLSVIHWRRPVWVGLSDRRRLASESV